MNGNPTTKEGFLNLSKEKFKGAEELFTSANADPRGRNTAQLLSLSIELSLKALILHGGTEPPRGHRMAQMYEQHLDDEIANDIPAKYSNLFYEFEGLYTQVRYDSNSTVDNLGKKMTLGDQFIQYTLEHIHEQDNA